MAIRLLKVGSVVSRPILTLENLANRRKRLLSTFIDGYKYTRIRPSFKKEYRRLASPLLLEFLYQFRDGVILGSFEFSGELFPFGESAAREEARRREIYRFGWAK